MGTRSITRIYEDDGTEFVNLYSQFVAFGKPPKLTVVDEDGREVLVSSLLKAKPEA